MSQSTVPQPDLLLFAIKGMRHTVSHAGTEVINMNFLQMERLPHDPNFFPADLVIDEEVQSQLRDDVILVFPQPNATTGVDNATKKEASVMNQEEEYEPEWNVVRNRKAKAKAGIRDGKTFKETAKGVKIGGMSEGSVRHAAAMDVHSLNARGKDVLEKTSLSQDAASKNQLMAYKSPKKRTLEEVEEHEEESDSTSFLYMQFSKAREKIAIKCLKSREYSSSVPVRYIPKKSSQVKKSENYQQTKVSEQKKSREFPDAGALKSEVKQCGRGVQKNRGFDEKPQNQNHVFYKNYLFNDVEKASPELEDQIDHLSGDVGYELMEEPEEVFEELNTHQVKKCYEKDVLHDAEKVAIKLLGTRAFTAVELRKKLHGKNFSLDTVEAVINDFISRGLINDSLYAEAFSRSRWSSSSWGPRRIKQALFSKGVSKLDAENAIKLVFEEGESDNDQKLVHGLSKLSMDNLLVQASKQWLRGQEVPKETRKSRIVRWLQYRGFSWDVIGFVLKKLESQYPP
ncbi:unnamed protein product [Prunus armeniaca]|uniref:Regulatory protein RecX n=1 Tax=Prunus armeniaca TaxID=36596 RepID=A0A6J5V3D2_PRUAR|nr:unnamed protein product [Prunus armeniaca]